MTHNQKGLVGIAISFAIAACQPAKGAESRYLDKLPESGKTTVIELIKSKAIGFQCSKVKRSPDSGNLVNSKTNKTKTWYTSQGFPANDNKAEESNSAFKCIAKSFQDGKMKNADTSETNED